MQSYRIHVEDLLTIFKFVLAILMPFYFHIYSRTFWSIPHTYKNLTMILIGNECIYRSIVEELILIKSSLPIHETPHSSPFTKIFCNFSEQCFVILVYRFCTYYFLLNLSLIMSWFFNAIVNGVFSISIGLLLGLEIQLIFVH